MNLARIIIFAKAPLPGKVKTRLVPVLGEERAAQLAHDMLLATVNEALAARVGVVELCASPGPHDAAWNDLLPPVQLHLTDQGEGDLGERVARAASRALASGEPVLLIGSDCPQLTSKRLRAAAIALESYDAVLVTAEDGGYVLLGLRRFDPTVFRHIPWSTSAVARETLDRIVALGWKVHVGKPLQDIDRPEDLFDLASPSGAHAVQVNGAADSNAALHKYERIAPFYDIIDLPFEYGRYRSIRPLLFAGLSGRILDAGVGTGRNMPYYPGGTEVWGIDLSPAMLTRAARRSSKSAAKVRLMIMDLVELDFPDDFFEAAIASFVFCTMPPDARQAALQELSRVVRLDGRVRLLEYTAAKTAFRRGVARLWQPWVDWVFGAKLDKDIELELARASFIVTNSQYVTSSIKIIEARPVRP